MNKIERFIRDIPDFPKPGILFRDITTKGEKNGQRNAQDMEFGKRY